MPVTANVPRVFETLSESSRRRIRKPLKLLPFLFAAAQSFPQSSRSTPWPKSILCLLLWRRQHNQPEAEATQQTSGKGRGKGKGRPCYGTKRVLSRSP